MKLFTKHKIYTEVEMQSRQDIILETYAKTINIEALTASDMVKRDILPAVSSYVAELASGVATKKASAMTFRAKRSLISSSVFPACRTAHIRSLLRSITPSSA